MRSIATNADYALIEDSAGQRKIICNREVRPLKEKRISRTFQLSAQSVTMLERHHDATKLPKWNIVDNALKAYLIKSKLGVVKSVQE